ncbi:hypothetical protein ER57_08670 [Smithella sp. SCADC]|jgi:hypothetical protein|nr:hypothetical protein ER57_08670 [Smithella sp. SCADC]
MARCLNDDERMIVSDRLENAGAVVSFLNAACCCLCEREQPLGAEDIFGMTLVYRWLEEDLKSLQKFILPPRT